MKIAVFTPKIYRTAFEEAIRVLNRQDCFFCLEYSDFYQISELYEQLRDSLDGILFSGNAPENYFHSRYPSVRLPICSIRHSQILTALSLLRFSRENPQIPLTKVFCDGIANVTDRKIYSDCLGPELMPRSLTTWHYTDHMLEELGNEIFRLYQTGEICHSFFTISSLYEQAAAKGLPCTHIALRPENIREGLLRILSITENQKPSDAAVLSMIFCYTTDRKPDYNETEYREATLKKLLVDYKKEQGLGELSIDSSNGRLELMLPALCGPGNPWQPLLDCFQKVQEQYSHSLLAGIGVGLHFQQAHSSALSALNYARDFAPGCCFCQQDMTLSGPLLTEHCLTLHTNLLSLSANIAAELSISPMNYVRTITLMEQRKASPEAPLPVTSELLARYLNVTPRSASRILGSLAKRKIIKEVPPLNPPSGKGRPVLCYELAVSSFI